MNVSVAGPIRTIRAVTATLIGYARCSTEKQDVEAQRQALLGLGVAGRAEAKSELWV